MRICIDHIQNFDYHLRGRLQISLLILSEFKQINQLLFPLQIMNSLFESTNEIYHLEN